MIKKKYFKKYFLKLSKLMLNKLSEIKNILFLSKN